MAFDELYVIVVIVSKGRKFLRGGWGTTVNIEEVGSSRPLGLDVTHFNIIIDVQVFKSFRIRDSYIHQIKARTTRTTMMIGDKLICPNL